MFKNIFFAVAAASISLNAFAAFNVDNVVEASKLALDDFKTTTHAEHFVGFKAWKSGDEAKVKVYVDHDGMAMEVNYLCHQHDGEIECHAQ